MRAISDQIDEMKTGCSLDLLCDGVGSGLLLSDFLSGGELDVCVTEELWSLQEAEGRLLS